jgi:hypothetical protein
VSNPSAPPRRVLYAEDDRVAALLFAEALRGRSDYELLVAETGAEALALAGQWQPDVLVVGGPPGGVPPPRRHLQAGFCGYWLKPVNPERLRAELDAAAASPSP